MVSDFNCIPAMFVLNVLITENVAFERQDIFNNYLDKTFSFLRSEKSVLKYFKRQRDSNPKAVDEVLSSYKECFYTKDVQLPTERKRRPFIVIEGDNFRNRETISLSLANDIGGQYLQYPPECMYHLRKLFSRGQMLKNALFSLSLYVAAFNVKQILASGIPVILNGYWNQQTEFLIRYIHSTSRTIPPSYSKMYSQPEDLLKPDMVIFLNHSPHVYKSPQQARHKRRFEYSQLKIYCMFGDPVVTIINATGDDIITLRNIQENIHSVLGDKFDFSKPNNIDSLSENLESKYSFLKDEESILSYFKKQREKHEKEVNSVLDSYKTCFNTEDKSLPAGKRKPFIVIEGNDYKTRETIAQKLSTQMAAHYTTFPTACMFHLRTLFRSGDMLKQAYFSLSLYAASFYVRNSLALGIAVIMNGYWQQQTEFIIRSIYKTSQLLPKPTSFLFQQPQNLTQPDIVIYLNHSSLSENKFKSIYKYSSIDIYKMFKDPPVTIISYSADVDETLKLINQKIKDVLGDKFDSSKKEDGGLFNRLTDLRKAMFKNEKSIINFFEDEWVKDKLTVNTVLQTYSGCFYPDDNCEVPSVSRKAFIVIEGTNFMRGIKVSKTLAKMTGSKALRYPPINMYNLRRIFFVRDVRKYALYALALYVSAFEARQALSKNTSVVLSGYWFQQATHIISQLYPTIDDLPPTGHEIYKRPTDLMMPDMLIFLNYSNPSSPFAQDSVLSKMLQIYKNYNFPQFKIINHWGPDNTGLARTIIKEVQISLGNKYDFSVT